MVPVLVQKMKKMALSGLLGLPERVLLVLGLYLGRIMSTTEWITIIIELCGVIGGT